ncbi:MAG: hypothetical protein K1000chlam3_01595, partial [Chlamydiae bacterium]|nr:hypothetical protein [Chlamydiota bacterium]
IAHILEYELLRSLKIQGSDFGKIPILQFRCVYINLPKLIPVSKLTFSALLIRILGKAVVQCFLQRDMIVSADDEMIRY